MRNILEAVDNSSNHSLNGCHPEQSEGSCLISRRSFALLRMTALLPILFFFSCIANAANGIYATVDSGFAVQTDLPSVSEAGATSVDNNLLPPALRFGIGYNHDVSQRFGVGLEAGLGWYARTIYHYADNQTTHVRSETSEFLLALMFHMNPQYDFFVKAGGIRISPVVSGKNAPPSDTKIAFESAVGGAYNINSNFAVTLTYAGIVGRNSHAINEICKNPPGLGELLLGLRYTFV